MIPTIRLAGENDKDNILNLLNNVFKDQQRSDTLRGDQYWQWKFILSPFGKSIITVAESDNEIIGVDNLWPWEFNIRGAVYKAYQPCDSVIHPGARGKGLFRKMRLYGLEVIREDNPAFMFNFPNSQSLNSNLSLGWFSMGQVPWMVRLIRPLRIVSDMSKTNKTETILIDNNYKLNIDLLEALDKDNFNHDSYIKPNRKKGYYEWRYLQHPTRHYGMIYLEKDKYASSAIFTVNQRSSYREMFIVEIIGNPKITYDLLKKTIETAKNLDISILTLMHNSGFGMDKLWQIGFIKKKAKNMVVLPLNLDFETILKKYSNWSLFACLHDSI